MILKLRKLDAVLARALHLSPTLRRSHGHDGDLYASSIVGSDTHRRPAPRFVQVMSFSDDCRSLSLSSFCASCRKEKSISEAGLTVTASFFPVSCIIERIWRTFCVLI